MEMTNPMAISKRLFAAILWVTAAPAWCAASSEPVDEGLQQAFTRAMYSVEHSGHGAYRGHNAAQQLSVEFDHSDVRLTHPEGSVDFHLTGYGYGERLQKPAPATLSASGNRLEYRRGELIEWYVNGSQGLEQGFTLTHRPRTLDREGQPLVIAIGMSGELTPVQKANEEAVQFESSHGVVLRYAGLKAWDARGRNLTSRFQVSGHELRLIVDDRKAEYPVTVDPTWTQQQELTPLDLSSGNHFAHSVAVSGDTAVIGAYDKTVDSIASAGGAYIFVRNNGVWTLQQELTAPDAAYADGFGLSVALDGDTAIIGTEYKEASYVFVRSGNEWTLQQELIVAAPNFGSSVAISGDTVLVGASEQEIGTHQGQGAAYVFVRNNGVWTQQQELTENGAILDHFGWSVALYGETALIGAPRKGYPKQGQGAAYVFVRSGGVWTLRQELQASDAADGDWFGIAVALNKSTALIGAPNKNIDSKLHKGAAYIFVEQAGVWAEKQEFIDSKPTFGDSFGVTVSVSGETAVIGAPGERISGTRYGAAYVYMRSLGVWSVRKQLTVPSAESFGNAASVDGDTIVVGDDYNGTYPQGTAFVFVH